MKKLLFLLLFATALQGQSDFEKEYQKNYESNIKKEYINEIYIPATFLEAFEELERLANPEAIAKFKSGEEAVVARKLHFGIGRWMAHNWNFENGSRLSHQMKEMGVTFPDDMIQFMIVSFYRHLNGIDSQMEERAKFFFDKRKKEQQDRIKEREELAVKNN